MKSSVLIGRLTADLLTRAGAIVDPGPGRALDVMAEPELRGTLGLGEFERLSFEPGVAGATFIDYDVPLVDRLSDVVNGLGRVARIQPPAGTRKLIDAAATIDRGVTIHNGVHRYHSHAAVDATYVGTAFEYTVLADERMGGVVTTWVNPTTRSTASFESRIDLTSLPDDPDAAKASEGTARSTAVWPLSVASARARVSPGITDFLERLRRRRERDLRRLREYYEEIDPRDPPQALAPSAGRRSAPARAQSSRRHAPRVSRARCGSRRSLSRPSLSFADWRVAVSSARVSHQREADAPECRSRCGLFVESHRWPHRAARLRRLSGSDRFRVAVR